MSPFQYGRLGDGQIRLLSACKIEEDGKISCELDSHQLEDSLEFFALSYVWGSDLITQTIRCNDQDLGVTENLARALVALQPFLETESRPIWIDAVCINQKDSREKEEQVPRMGSIYKSAERVIVWLGPEAHSSNLVMEQIVSVTEILRELDEVPQRDQLESLGLPSQNDPLWPALGHFYRRPWFRRLWTFQEAVLARFPLQVVCGNETAEWNYIRILSEQLNRNGLSWLAVPEEEHHDLIATFASIADVSGAEALRRAYEDSKAHLPIFIALRMSRLKQCKEPRDKIYGMLSLLSQEARGKIPVSYSMDTGELYLATGKASLEESGIWYLLLAAGRPRLVGIATWCFDLSSAGEGINAFKMAEIKAGIDESSGHDELETIKTFNDSHHIELNGFRADKVQSVGQPFEKSWSGTKVELAKKRHDWHKSNLLLAKTNQHDERNGDVLLSYAYTIIGTPISGFPDSNTLQRLLQHVLESEASEMNGYGSLNPPAKQMGLFLAVLAMLFRTCAGRRFFTTSKGRLGLGPPEMQPGDVIVVIYGAGPIFVLREKIVEGNTVFDFIGDGFVHGLMELSNTPLEDRGKEETFTVI